MPAPFGALSPGELGEQAPTALDQLVAGIINGTASIPKHVIDATMNAAPPGLRREDYTDAPAPGGLTQAWQPGDEMRAASMDVAANLAGVGAPFSTAGAAGVFGGRLAATADKAALAEAERLAAGGADRQAIWDKTGWFKGSDDKWRFEIPDYRSQMNQRWHDNGLPNGDMGPIAGQLWHKPLYEAYPDLRRITGVAEKTAGESGAYTPAFGGNPKFVGRDEAININAPNAPAARSVALHEMQHAIQEREGFAQGGSPSMFSQSDDAKLAREALSYRREIEKLDPKLNPKQKDDIIRKQYEDIGAPEWFPSQAARDVAHDIHGNPGGTLQRVMELYGTDKTTGGFTPRQLYRELPGEIEARNVQSRRDMTPAELSARPPWQTADIDARPVMNEIFGGGRVGSLAGSRVAEMVPPDVGKSFGIPGKLPDSDIFSAAVKNTPGARIEDGALVMPLSRRQHPDQELAQSVRGGVFYKPGGAGGYSYTGKNGYGGSQAIEGETAIKAPLFVKGATGGKAPEAAFDTINGKGSYQDMRTDALKSMGPLWGAKPGEKEAAVRGFLEKYAPELADNAYDILRNSSKGNQLAYALQEAAVASAARRAGHDAVIGYSTRRGADKQPFISEVFDVRESHYPGTAGEFETWPASMFGGGVGSLKGK